MLKEWYIARHGETVWNVEKIVQGWKDSPLTQRGILQVRELGSALRDKGIELIICGDLGRQRQTAAELMPYVNAPAEYTYLLRERGTGNVDGVSYAELGIVKEDFGFYDKDGKGIFASAEPLEQVVGRARQVLEKVIALPQNRILTIGSAWTNSYIVNLLLNEGWIYHNQENATTHRFLLNSNGYVIGYELKEKAE